MGVHGRKVPSVLAVPGRAMSTDEYGGGVGLFPGYLISIDEYGGGFSFVPVVRLDCSASFKVVHSVSLTHHPSRDSRRTTPWPYKIAQGSRMMDSFGL